MKVAPRVYLRVGSAVLQASLVCFLSALGASRLNARNGTTLTGTVRSETGAPVANANISVRGLANGYVTSLSTDSDGAYAVGDLAAGRYQLMVSAAGFAEAHRMVNIAAGPHQVADLVLTAAAPSADGANSRLITEVPPAGADVPSLAAPAAAQLPAPAPANTEEMNAKAVGDLPLNGRSASDVAALEPGVMKARTQTTNGHNGYGVQMTVFGTRPRQNNVSLDGISVNDYANGPFGSAGGTSLGVDAIESLSVLTTNDQAQYGRSSGGYISSTTRSGTKTFHGSVFEYLRNSVLDARNYFDLAQPPFRRNQFGATAGGPLAKNRLFIFGDYEGIRQSQGVSNVASVPSAAARLGNLSTGVVAVDPSIRRILDAFYPLPNAGLLGSGDTGVYRSSAQKVTPGDHFITRLDYKPSDKDSLGGVYMFDGSPVTSPDKLAQKLIGNQSRQAFLALTETHAFSSQLLSSFRLGLYRMVAHSGTTYLLDNPLQADTSYGAVPGQTVPIINVPGLVRLFGGLNGADIYHFHWTSLQAYEDVSLTRGRHALRFGGFVDRMRDNVQGTLNPTGVLSFNSLADFLSNRPFSFSASLPGSEPERGFRQTILGGYAQDNWLLKSNLSLNLGLRYEMATVPTEVHGYLSTLRDLTDAQPAVGQPLFSNPTLRNFEPRVGVAWDPQRNGKALVSSSFGLFDVLPLPYQIQYGELFSAPFYASANVINLPAGSYPSGAFALALASPNTARQAYFQPHPGRNYVMRWNLTLRRELPLALNMKIGYVGSRGVHEIFRVKDADIVLPTLTPQGYLWPSPAGSGPRLNPNAGLITAAFWNGDSYYDALLLQIQRKLGHAGQVTGSYTWGKAIDTSSGSMEGDEYTNAITSPLWFDTRLNRGPSDFNIAQDLKVIYSWEIPSPTLASALISWPLSGWQMGGVYEASSGLPFTPGFGGDPLGVQSTDPNLDVPNRLRGPGCDSLVTGDPNHYIKTQCLAAPNPLTLRGNFARNSIVGPNLRNLDVFLFKNHHVKRISDSANVQFRAEVFNIFNRANFNPPIYFRNAFDSQGNPVGSAGVIDSTQTSSRQIQFALKLYW